ncbi:SulP family inorganic anion transporter [Lacinutrix neustonica]|uniref:SulP family inorganic anion transporter n=1 Tax=Lacinutrix neustonica TaxID=2980107 RepID=UPI0028BEC836|nr:SulP family inorganic anion transporter [Lacinutrix neustonica]
MSPKKNNIKSFFKTLPRNIFSGFVVSLIALPLGLGLAMASDAPPISGVIAAVIGGVVVSILGGSHVTISRTRKWIGGRPFSRYIHIRTRKCFCCHHLFSEYCF